MPKSTWLIEVQSSIYEIIMLNSANCAIPHVAALGRPILCIAFFSLQLDIIYLNECLETKPVCKRSVTFRKFLGLRGRTISGTMQGNLGYLATMAIYTV